MKKARKAMGKSKAGKSKLTGDMRPEYDFASMKGGVRGKYAARFGTGTTLVLLEPDIARAFPTDAAVNQTLRVLLDMTALLPRTKLPGRRASGERG
jgi:hypothetical protein